MPFWQLLSNFIFPQSCELCGKILSFSQILCKECFKLYKWFDYTARCLKCLSEVDLEEKICLSCKRGFFFPKKIWIILNHPLPFSIIDTDLKQKFILSLFTIFINEVKILQDYTGIDFINPKLFSNQNYKKEFQKLLNLPYSKKDPQKNHVLLIGLRNLSKTDLNKMTLDYLKKGYEEVSFIFFHIL